MTLPDWIAWLLMAVVNFWVARRNWKSSKDLFERESSLAERELAFVIRVKSLESFLRQHGVIEKSAKNETIQ